MKSTTFSLAVACLVLTVFSLTCLGETRPATGEPKLIGSKKAADPIVVSAETLAQAVEDDVNAAAKKYHLTDLQIEGVVAARSEFKGRIAAFQFHLKVQDRKANKQVEFILIFVLKDPLMKGDKRLDEFAVGTKVTVRGRSTAMGNRQVTLTSCEIVRGNGKDGANQGTKKQQGD